MRASIIKLIAIVILAVSPVSPAPLAHAQPDGSGDSNVPGSPSFDGGEDLGGDAAKRLANEDPNRYRFRKPEDGDSRQPETLADVANEMKKSFAKVIVGGALVDKATSPHLHDIRVKGAQRELIVKERVTHAAFWCPAAAPLWEERRFNTNFKICCVKREDKFATWQQLACKQPYGQSWAGLFEFWAPTTAIEWSNQTAQGVFATKEEFQKGLQQINELKKGQFAEDFVKQGIDSAQQGSQTAGADGVKKPDEQIIKQTLEDLQKIPENLRNTVTNRSGVGGVIVRPNLAWLSMGQRKSQARRYCMHPDQLDKVMHENEFENPYQLKPPGGRLLGGDLKFYPQIPLFGTNFKNGWLLSSDVRESALVRNIHNTPTKLDLGYKNGYLKYGWAYCDRYLQAINSYYLSGLPEVLDKVGAKSFESLEEIGYSCWKESMMPWSPLVLNRYTPNEHRSPGEIVQWLIAAAYYNSPIAGASSQLTTPLGAQSYYVPYEPQPYAVVFGEQFLRDYPKNERDQPCSQFEGENEAGKRVADKFWASPVPQGEEKDYSFAQDIIKDPSAMGKWFRKWAKRDGRTPTRGLDEGSLNHATSMRFYASCPAGYVKWAFAPPQCGQEKLW